MTILWTQSKRCAIGDLCHLCRLIGVHGERWRRQLHTVHGYIIPEVNFDCPHGKEWSASSCKTCGGD